MELLVFDSAEEVARRASTRVEELVSASREWFSLGLAGGTTPLATYGLLRERAIDWSRVNAWLSDERWVPPDHERSNGRMAAESLLDHVDASFHRPRWAEDMTAADSAADYEARLRSIFEGGRSDLIILGMGDDGHTASLFPGHRHWTRRPAGTRRTLSLFSERTVSLPPSRCCGTPSCCSSLSSVQPRPRLSRRASKGTPRRVVSAKATPASNGTRTRKRHHSSPDGHIDLRADAGKLLVANKLDSYRAHAQHPHISPNDDYDSRSSIHTCRSNNFDLRLRT